MIFNSKILKISKAKRKRIWMLSFQRIMFWSFVMEKNVKPMDMNTSPKLMEELKLKGKNTINENYQKQITWEL